MGSEDEIPKKSFFSSWWPQLLAVSALIALTLVTFLLWLEMSKRFPLLTPGSYVGALEHVLGEGEPTTIYIERAVNGQEFLVVVFRSGWEPQIIPSIAADPNNLDGAWLHPIALAGPNDVTLQLVGSQAGGERYSGTVTDSKSGKKGSWWIQNVPQESMSLTDKEKQQMHYWMLSKSELDSVNSQIKKAEERAPQQKAEIRKLNEVLAEGEKLKSKANEKLAAIRAELTRSQEAVKAKQAEARNLGNSFDLSQRVTGMGKLVSLSRDSLEKDWRWVDSILKGSANGSEEFETAYQQALKISDIKKEIALEQQKIDALLVEGVNVR